MKCFAVVCLLVTLTAADYVVRTSDDLQEYREACFKELNVPADHIEKLNNWEHPDDSITHCYLKCIFTKFEFFDAQSGFNVDNIYAQLASAKQDDYDEELHDNIAACFDNNEQGSNGCEWVARGATCLLTNYDQLIKKSLETKDSTAAKSKNCET